MGLLREVLNATDSGFPLTFLVGGATVPVHQGQRD